ncbi:hypothetical protein ES703_37813 [subsurface metagenome]
MRLKEHCDTFVKPARQTKLKVPAVKLMPSLVPKSKESSLSADIICHAGAIMVIGTSLYFAKQLRLLARKGPRKIFPLPAVGKKINGKPGARLDRPGQLTIIAAICQLNKSGNPPKHQRLQERCENLIMSGS